MLWRRPPKYRTIRSSNGFGGKQQWEKLLRCLSPLLHSREAADSNEISSGSGEDGNDSSSEVENAEESSQARHSEGVCELQRFSPLNPKGIRVREQNVTAFALHSVAGARGRLCPKASKFRTRGEQSGAQYPFFRRSAAPLRRPISIFISTAAAATAELTRILPPAE